MDFQKSNPTNQLYGQKEWTSHTLSQTQLGNTVSRIFTPNSTELRREHRFDPSKELKKEDIIDTSNILKDESHDNIKAEVQLYGQGYNRVPMSGLTATRPIMLSQYDNTSSLNRESPGNPDQQVHHKLLNILQEYNAGRIDEQNFLTQTYDLFKQTQFFIKINESILSRHEMKPDGSTEGFGTSSSNTSVSKDLHNKMDNRNNSNMDSQKLNPNQSDGQKERTTSHTLLQAQLENNLRVSGKMDPIYHDTQQRYEQGCIPGMPNIQPDLSATCRTALSQDDNMNGLKSEGSTADFPRDVKDFSGDTKDAISLVNLVEQRFRDNPEILFAIKNKFEDLKSQSIDTPSVITQLWNLLKGHPNLISRLYDLHSFRCKIDDEMNRQGNASRTSFLTTVSDPITTKSATLSQYNNTSSLDRENVTRHSQRRNNEDFMDLLYLITRQFFYKPQLFYTFTNIYADFKSRWMNFRLTNNRLRDLFEEYPELIVKLDAYLSLYDSEEQPNRQEHISQASTFMPNETARHSATSSQDNSSNLECKHSLNLYDDLDKLNSFANMVQRKFNDEPEVCHEFANIMREYKTGRINMSNVSIRMNDLFKQYPDIISQLNDCILSSCYSQTQPSIPTCTSQTSIAVPHSRYPATSRHANVSPSFVAGPSTSSAKKDEYNVTSDITQGSDSGRHTSATNSPSHSLTAHKSSLPPKQAPCLEPRLLNVIRARNISQFAKGVTDVTSSMRRKNFAPRRINFNKPNKNELE